jgi:hypothetical protein
MPFVCVHELSRRTVSRVTPKYFAMLKRLSPERTVYSQQRGRFGHRSSSAYLPLLGRREARGDAVGAMNGDAEADGAMNGEADGDGARTWDLVAVACGVGFGLATAIGPDAAEGLFPSIVNALQKTMARRPTPMSTAIG